MFRHHSWNSVPTYWTRSRGLLLSDRFISIPAHFRINQPGGHVETLHSCQGLPQPGPHPPAYPASLFTSSVMPHHLHCQAPSCSWVLPSLGHSFATFANPSIRFQLNVTLSRRPSLTLRLSQIYLLEFLSCSGILPVLVSTLYCIFKMQEKIIIKMW